LITGVVQVRDEVMPLLLGMDGCSGPVMPVDGQSGWYTVASARQTGQAAGAGQEQLQPVRDHAIEMLGGAPQG
jgi:hypothetical protein